MPQNIKPTSFLPLRSYGRVASRMGPDEQAALKTRIETVRFDPTAPCPTPLVIEIGSGMGDLIMTRAGTEPETHFVACEVYLNGLGALTRFCERQRAGNPATVQAYPEILKQVQDDRPAEAEETPSPPPHATVPNLSLWPDDARGLTEKLPENSADELLILFPDPWPKARHHKRRLVQRGFLGDLARVLKKNGTLTLATDWADYAAWMETEIAACERLSLTSRAVPEWWVETKYARKARAAGRELVFLSVSQAG